MAPDTRDAVVDFVREFSGRTEVPVTRVVGWLGIHRGKFFDWRQRYGKANEHNALVPRDHWLEEAERPGPVPLAVQLWAPAPKLTGD